MAILTKGGRDIQVAYCWWWFFRDWSFVMKKESWILSRQLDGSVIGGTRGKNKDAL